MRTWKLLGMCACVCFVPAGARAQEPGDTVIVVQDTQIKADDKSSQTVFRGLALTVQDVRGDLVLVSSEVTGWVSKKHLATPVQAVDVFIDQIEKNPRDAGAYSARGMVWFRRGEPDIALGDFSDAIELNPKSFDAFSNRGLCWAAKGEFAKALSDYNEAIRLNPKNANGYNNRGNLWTSKGNYDKAINDFSEAIRLNPKSAVSFANRGGAWIENQEYEKAIADCTEAIRLDPKYVTPYLNRAIVYATCPDAKYRSGKQAVQNAETACELSGWRIANQIGTLAAACAEDGDFEAAVKWQTKANDMYTPSQREKYAFLLDLYKAGRPYHRERKKPGI